MAKGQHIIELNGQKYDALTGKLLTTAQSAAVQKPAKLKPLKAATATKNLDGFTRRPAHAKSTHTVASPTTAVHKQPAKSQTLMRTAVKPPASKKIHAKAAANHDQAPKAKQSASSLFGSIKPGTAIRASSIGQSNLISKFGRSAPSIKNEVIPVKPIPGQAKKPVQHPAAAEAPAKHAAAPHKPAKAAHKPNQFQAALENASSHHQPKIKKPRLHHRVANRLHVSHRLVSFVGIAIMAIGVAGFFAYQNMPELAMRVASTRAGLNANLPKYQPAGFSMAGPIEYQPGAVSVNYKSNSDDRSFSVTQKNSSWNSETLLENYVSPTKEPYQTFQAKGRTIYIYDGNKATWVDGGVWYNIDGKTNLNSDQLLRIAESL